MNGGVRTGNRSQAWDPDPTQGATLPVPAVAKVTINAQSPPDALPANLVNVANVLTHSAEALGVFIQQAYNLYLHRSAHPDGLKFWTDKMQVGLTDEALEANFLGSAEYIQNHGGTGSAWVNGMYEDLLGRKADAGGLSFWVDQLQKGADPLSVALGFAAGAERETMRIGADYELFLGRNLDPGGQQFWVKQFLNGARNEAVVGGFIGSPEYWSNLAKGQQNKQAWIRSAFQDVLHRDPTSTDLTFWSNILE